MKLGDRLTRMEAMLEHNNTTTDKLAKLLEGTEGVVVRLDRTERSYKCLRRWMTVTGAAAVTALIQKSLPALARLFH